METELKVVHERLARLERSVRRWKVVAAALAVTGLIAVAAGALAPPKDLEVSSLTVVDKQGNARVVLETQDEILGSGNLTLYNAKGKGLLSLQAMDDGFATMECKGADGKTGLVLGVLHNGIPQLHMNDPRSRSMISFGGTGPELRAKVLDAKGSEVFHAP